MHNLTKVLLCGAAVGALLVAPATAATQPAMHVTALYAGHVVNKTKLHNHGATHVTYTYGVYSDIQFSDYFRQKKRLPASFFGSGGGPICTPPKVKVEPRKTLYGRASVSTETYSFGCPSGPTKIYGAAYKITDPDAKGKTDFVRVIEKSKFQNGSTKYKGTLNLDITISIE